MTAAAATTRSPTGRTSRRGSARFFASTSTNATGGQQYGIPKDNPFVDVKGAKPEIYAFGFRNPWRITFDRQTGDLWEGEVGQDYWEEINIVTKGGNYGWSFVEGTFPFSNREYKMPSQPIGPVWEYDHQVGKSITGGYVYRGKALPELEGVYLYADFVTGKIWGLKYDVEAKKLEWNKGIPSDKLTVLAFGEDEAGEVYFSVPDSHRTGDLQVRPGEVTRLAQAFQRSFKTVAELARVQTGTGIVGILANSATSLGVQFFVPSCSNRFSEASSWSLPIADCRSLLDCWCWHSRRWLRRQRGRFRRPGSRSGR